MVTEQNANARKDMDNRYIDVLWFVIGIVGVLGTTVYVYVFRVYVCKSMHRREFGIFGKLVSQQV